MEDLPPYIKNQNARTVFLHILPKADRQNPLKNKIKRFPGFPENFLFRYFPMEIPHLIHWPTDSLPCASPYSGPPWVQFLPLRAPLKCGGHFVRIISYLSAIGGL